MHIEVLPGAFTVARSCPLPGNAAAGAAVNSRIQRRNTLSARSRSRAACAAATPRSVTSLTASTLNSRANFRLTRSNLRFMGHDLIFMSTKPAAVHFDPGLNRTYAEIAAHFGTAILPARPRKPRE